MKFLIVLIFLAFNLVGESKNIHFKIEGYTEIISGSKKVTLYISGSSYVNEIKNGKFVFDLNLKEEGLGMIKTDSSFTCPIWITAVNYSFKLKEREKTQINFFQISIEILKVPKSAKLYNNFNEVLSSKGTGDTLKYQHKYISHIIDSIIKTDPKSSMLPDLLNVGIIVLNSKELIRYKKLIKTPGSDEKLVYLLKDLKQRELLKPGLPFLNFTMRDNNDSVFSLYSLKSKLTLIEFWGTDCPPCRLAHNSLRKMYNKYHNSGLEIISVSTDTDKKSWLNSIAVDSLKWINVSDLKGWKNALADHYNVYYEPLYIWLDDKHRILNKRMRDSDIFDILHQQ